MHNPFNTAISFALLISVVGASFYYVYATDPKEPWLGIEGSNVTPAVAQILKLQQPRGFLIFAVETTSPADVAGARGGAVMGCACRESAGGVLVVQKDH